jgi:hypothetical protein
MPKLISIVGTDTYIIFPHYRTTKERDIIARVTSTGTVYDSSHQKCSKLDCSRAQNLGTGILIETALFRAPKNRF